jgi:glycosyltransferase involved in cell wall biosynthesis
MSAEAPTIAFDVLPGNSGPARYVAALARGLEAAGWNVAYLASDEAAPASAEMGRTSAAKALGLRRIVPRFARCWSGFGRQSRRLAQALRPVKCDLLHTQNTGCEEMPVAARWAGMPRVLGTFHVDSTYDLGRVRSDFAHRALEWLSNRSLHRAIAVSEATKRDWMQRTGMPGARIATIHNGIDPERFQRRRSQAEARGRLGLPRDATILGGLGRLDPAKGFADLIAAAALLRSEFPQLIVAIAGAGPLQEQLQAKAAAMGIANRVALLGFQADVNLVLEALDVFVLPSLCEALPFALLEAMAHELPAVGTTVGGVPEVIVPGETGFLSLPRDSAALAAAIRPLAASAQLRERLGGAGRRRVERHFHEQDMVRQTLAVYEQMLTRRPVPRAVAAP